ncbi:Gretchen Hagen 3.17 [Hibiscus trionum]|uniref:Gretchen Hagen 3.17 n=1 Tax=Hibiscus trionum TaxID=183268 RepID=A0A9W7IVI4_HIBTR|nr:Gretchen Hagen 3.17 [Hibiscus trionum]
MDPSFSTESAWKIFEEQTINAYQTQQQVLEEILSQNLHTEYLSQFLGRNSDREDFKAKVPVVEYEYIKPYILRIANGEPSDILLAETVTALTRSSGTSAGQPKMIPLTDRELDRRAFGGCLRSSVVNRFVDGFERGERMHLHLQFNRPEIKTPSGFPTRSILTSIFLSKYFEQHESSLYTSPIATILCLDSKQSMYCQWLCGLLYRNQVVSVGSIFGSILVRGIKFLEDYWKEICSNIRTGQLSDWISDTGCRNALSTILGKPNPELADSIEDICNAKSWEGIIKKLWPGTKYMDATVTGSMLQYVPMLEFYCGDLPLVSKCYSSSECELGINIKPLSKPCDTSYTFIPNMAYFEFLPIHEDSEESELVDLVNVKLGRCYEAVVTTFTGLYRCKMGDILKATDYHNNTPQFQFVRRKGVFLSVDMEKTTEDELGEAVKQANLFIRQFGLHVTDYTGAVDICSIPGHYVLFWELKMEGSSDLPELSPGTIEQCCYIVEESLSLVYRVSRKGNGIEPLEIRVVKNGTFDELMDFFVSKGSSVSQYKTPRCIRIEEALKILNSRVVGRYFSQQIPASTPLKW